MPQQPVTTRLARVAVPALLVLSAAVNAAESAQTATPGEPAAAGDAAAAPAPATKAETGYSMGIGFGAQLHSVGISELDLDAVMQGLKAGMAGVAPTAADRQRVVTAVREAQTAIAAKNAAEGAAFLEKNGKSEGVSTTPSGLQYRVINAGDAKAASPKPTDQVTVNYSGRLIDGTEFDSSYKRGQPATFGVSQVIPGWTEAVQLMKPGAKFQLFIPSQLAYGNTPPQGSPIKPGAMLIFDVELISVTAPKAPATARPKPKAGAAKQPVPNTSK